MNRICIILAAMAVAGPAFAGSGSLNGNHTITINGNSDRAIICNSHRFGGDGSQRFACEYADQTALGQPNDSLFIGEISTMNTNGQNRAFQMTQVDDQSQYYAVYSGQVSSAGAVSGTVVDNSGNTFSFTLN